jgi:NADH-quinone oxidoreductase subunit H
MGDPVTFIAQWMEDLLLGWGVSPQWVTILLTAIGVVAIAVFVLLVDILLVWVERKVVARFQDRLGPNRLGPFGLIQPIADVIKLLIKEDITPIGADRIVYNLPPIIALASVLMLWAVIPLAPTIVGTDLDVGVLYVVALGAIGTLGIIMAGWASNNKYALVGAFRTVAQMVSYEVPMVIALMVPVLLAGSMGINTIVFAQTPVWYVVVAPLAALIVFITAIAELGRAPFDLTEAESEIVAGFHIEYTGMKFGMFYAGELLHAITISGLVASLFLGGWRGPGAEAYPILGVVYFFIKAFFLYWAIMWIKYSMPRIRIDHMLSFNWKFLTPLALVVLIVTAILDKLFAGFPEWLYVVGMLLANLVMIWFTVQILRSRARVERKRVAEPGPIAAPQNPSVSSTSS